MNDPKVFTDFTSKLAIARVESIDYLVDGTGSQVLDGNQNYIPTGLLNVAFLEKGGGRNKVPFIVPSGNSAFSGGLPELGSTCVVGFGQAGEAIILGFMPPSLHALINSRQVIPNLVPGEQLIQGSIPDFDANADANFFVGAQVYLDRYGRLKITGLDYEFVMGYLLSNENTPNVTKLIDPISGNPIYFREKIKGFERRIDDKGNAFTSYPKNKVSQVAGDRTDTVNGQVSFTAKKGFNWSDGKGNSVQLNTDGSFQIILGNGTLQLTSMGNIVQECGATLNKTIVDDDKATIGRDYTRSILGKRSIQVGGSDGAPADELIVTLGDSTETIVAGSKIIEAAEAAVLSGSVNMIGIAAVQPIPLGLNLLAILSGTNGILPMIAALAALVPGGPAAIAPFASALVPLLAAMNSLVSLVE
jgi:hypothetical protein